MMEFTETFFNLLIDFGDEWRIVKVESDHKLKEIYLDVEYCGDSYKDPKTGELASLYDHSPERLWRHLDVLDYKSFIRCKVPRVRCEDGKVKRVSTSWSNQRDRHTYSFEIKVIDCLRATQKQTRTAELMGCSFRLVNRIIHRCTDRGMSRREISDLPFEHISIDEKSFKKGHKYVTVLSHPRSGCVIDVGENRDQKSVEELLEKAFTISQLDQILTVSMDMWKSYINTANKKMPNAEIVHDRFHLIKYLNEAIDRVRRREVRDNEVLKKSRYALLKNEENRTEKQKERFEQVVASNLEVAKTYHAKEAFKTLFDLQNNDKDAKVSLINWAKTFYMYNIKELNK